MSDIIPEGILYGNLGVGSGTTNYNDLDNKPQINSVTLQGNKTASELGLVGTSDIPVTSVNGETGAVVLDGTEIEFSTGVSINEKIIAVEQEIPVIAYPVTSVNGETGAVVLDGTEINYQAGKTINQKIDEVEAEIPVVSYPVTSVNGETGAVVLDGTDIEYSSGVSVNSIINTITQYTPVYGNTASGAIATFDTSLALPLQDLQIAINGTNLTGANVRVTGSNLWDEEWLHGYYNTSGDYVSNANYLCSKNMFRVTPNTTYYYLVPTGYTGRIVYYDMNGGFISRTGTGTANNTFTTPANCYYIHLLVDNYSSDYNNDISVLYPATDTEYHAYNANSTTTSISWNYLGTISEGSLDVTTGKLTVVNGSMGAGDYQITPIPINALSGTNNIFCDTGNTSVVYACSLKDYIDSQ